MKLTFEKSNINFSIVFILISMWILNHPYKGLIHDQRLYALQAMGHIKPEIFKNDFFLRYGSQDKYTIFSYPYEYIIKLTGLAPASKIIFVCGHILWFISAYLLVSALYQDKKRFIALAFAISMPSYYGAKSIFCFGEPFLTPRIFTEAFVVLSIYFVLKNKIKVGVFSLFLGFIVHPIMAFTGFLFYCSYFIIRHKKLAIIIGSTLGVIVISLAFLKVTPFDRLFQSMDPHWSRIVHKRSDFLFPSKWSLQDFTPIIASFFVTLLYALTNRGAKQSIAISILVATGISLFLSTLLGDFLGNVLVLQLQIWRVLWLLLFFSYLALPAVYIKVKNHTDFGISFLFIYGISWLSPLRESPLYVILLTLSFLLIVGNYDNKDQLELRHIPFLKNRFSKDFLKKMNIIMALFPIILLIISLTSFIYACNKVNEESPYISLSIPLKAIYSALILIFIGAPLLYYQLEKKKKNFIIPSVLLLILSTSQWDRRLEYEQILEKMPRAAQVDLIKKIPKHSEILWCGFPELSWFFAHRDNYVSRLQGAGIVFSRKTALLYDQRTRHVGTLSELDNPLKFYRYHKRDELTEFYKEAIIKCSQNAKNLDFIIAPYNISEYQPLKVLSMKNVRANYGHIIINYKNFDWYLYNCKQIKMLNLDQP